jgi:hypothetical protein
MATKAQLEQQREALFSRLVEQYWAARTYEAWSLVEKLRKELVKMGAKRTKDGWTL